MAVESFVGLDGGEGTSEAAFEAFKEKMKRAAAQIAAIKKEEKKHKKKEEELVKILLRFIKKSQKRELVLLVSRTLEQNIPANFILAIILLGNEDIQKEIGDYLMLKEGENKVPDEKALIFFGEDETMPLKIKIEMDQWIKGLIYQAEETPEKLLRTSYDIEMIEKDEGEDEEKKTIKTVLTHLVAFIMRDYLEDKKVETEHGKLKEFAKFIIKGILDKTKESLDNRKFLKD